MKMKNHLIILVLFIAANAISFAQNARFSQEWSVPSHFNPSLIGRFDGQARVSFLNSWQQTDSGKLNHENISAEIKLGKYKTSGDEPTGQKNILSVFSKSSSNKDAKDQIYSKTKQRGYWAAGVNYYHYGNTTAPIDAGFLAISAARHFYNRSNKIYGLGAQVAFANGELDESRGLKYDKEISGGGFRYPVNNTGAPKKTSANYVDFNVGAYYGMNSEIVMFELGVAIHHITAPVIDITGTDKESRLRRKVAAHALFRIKANEKWGAIFRNMYWKEGLYYRSRTYKDSLEIQCFWSGVELYKINPAKKFNLNFGLFTRSFKTYMPYLNINVSNFGTIRYSHEEPFNSKQFRAYNAVRDELSLSLTLGRNSVPGNRFYKKMQYW